MALCALLCVGLARTAHADVFRPAYLQLTQTSADSYDVLWKAPALDERTTLRVQPTFPAETQVIADVRSQLAAGMVVQRWRIRVPGSLNGKPIGFGSMSATGIDILVRLERPDGSVQLERISPRQPSFIAKASPGSYEVAKTYTTIGVEHILAGCDHLLFVLALMMVVHSTRRLLWAISAFTLAHSITLSLATLGVLHVPGPPVEALIALSIVFVAGEILRRRQGREGLASRQPWLIAFAFGLLHGLGFAGALAEVGLPEGSIPLALLFFNVGVEIGQVLFIAAALAAYYLLKGLLGHRFVPERWVAVPVYLIGGVASYWVVERVSAF
jgi:hydrogenase/urease accessory protein HupE